MESTKKILIFSLVYYPKMVSGAEIAVQEVTRRIDPSSVEFDLITLRLDASLPKHEKIGNVNVYRIGFSKKAVSPEELVRFPMYLAKVWFPIGAFLKAVSLDRKRHYDGLWSIMSYMAFPALFFNWFYRRVPYVLSIQDGDSIEHVTKRWRIRFLMPFLRVAFRKAALLQVISSFLADYASAMGGSAVVVPNGVNLKAFSSPVSPEEILKLKMQLGASSDSVFLITTSRLVSKNAVGDIIRALPFLQRRVALLVLGAGPLLGTLVTLARELGVADRVHFLGSVEQEKIPAYLKVAEVFVRPSLSEGFGISFIEAMAAGVPVIATPVGGIVDFLEEGENGLYAKPGHPETIANAVKQILEDEELRKKLIENGKKTAVRYDWSLIAKRMDQEVFEKLRQNAEVVGRTR